MKKIVFYFLFLIFFVYTNNIIAGNGHKFTIFVVGNFAGAQEEEKLTLQLVKQSMDAGKNSAIIFLGTNMDWDQICSNSNEDKNFAEKALNSHYEFLERYKGKVFFVPGKEEWDNGSKNGLKQVRYCEETTEEALERGNIFLPDYGCTGPIEIQLSKTAVLILFDSQSWLHPWNRPHSSRDEPFFKEECDIKDECDFFIRINDAIKRNSNKHVILATYHPLYSSGHHGGKFGIKTHIFPLTVQNPNLFVPLPVIGSMYVGYRKVLGNPKDLAHYKYRKFRKNIEDILKNKKDLIYTASLEKNLQYRNKENIHHVISGSGQEPVFVKENGKSDFAIKEKGFAKIELFNDGKAELYYYSSKKDQPIYQKTLYKKKISSLQIVKNKPDIDYRDSIVKAFASKQYKAGAFKRFLLGNNYREVWQQPVEVPVFDVTEKLGGMKIVKRGGGQQTRSIRLETDDGRQSVLRSLEKYTEKAIPEELQNTFAASLVQDQISASHPYGALVAAELAEAVGVLHTNPSIVFVPDDPQLGIYREEMAGGLYLYEERADEEWDKTASFGPSEKIYGTPKVLDKIKDDNDDRIDQMAVLRARLLDIFINDWDRHDDQWRWAGYEKNNDWFYKPIPRDRDQVFFLNEGIIPWIASRKWALRKIQGFEPFTKDIPGLAYNARHFDRTFLTEPSLYDWLAISDTLKTLLTDSVIEKAVKTLPKEIYEITGKEIEETLKARRENLGVFAESLYTFLAKKVNVVGSDKHELFNIERLNDDETLVTVYKTKKDGEVKNVIYKRLFKTDETKEIRLYGLDGEDQFVIKGDVNKGPKIRIIGGEDEDHINDESKVRGLSRKNIYYDLVTEDNEIEVDKECRVKTSKNPSVNEYDRKAFQYDYLAPLITGGYNRDDGIYIGAGAKLITHGFRKEPFATNQKITASIALATEAYHFAYEGEFTSLIGKNDLVVDAQAKMPNYTLNYFGLGNETQIENRHKDYYRLKYNQLLLNPSLRRNFGDYFSVSGGLLYEYTDLKSSENTFVAEVENINKDTTIKQSNYGGFSSQVVFDNRNDDVYTTNGMKLLAGYRYYDGWESYAKNFHKVNSEFSFFCSYRNSERIVLAIRLGGAANFGDYPFYKANVLGGKTNLRGYRKQRFAGDYNFYQNSEIRLRLMNFSNYVFTGKLGITAFNDVGKVWFNDEDSKKWHHGYGGGLWIAPFTKAVISSHFGFSREGHYITVKLSQFY